jgi:hypothetical protein
MSTGNSDEGIDSMFREFIVLYENNDCSFYAGDLFDSTRVNKLNMLAKKIVNRLTPDELAFMNGEKHAFGDKLTDAFAAALDKDSLVKIAKLYEDLEDYDSARKAYAMTSDNSIISDFISRSTENRKSICCGASALDELKDRNARLCMAKTIFYKSCGFRNYRLALDMALFINDAYKDGWFLAEAKEAMERGNTLDLY